MDAHVREGQHVWHNPCCLALLDVPAEERPASWLCEVCGADWTYDSHFASHVPDNGPYWHMQLLRNAVDEMQRIRRVLERPRVEERFTWHERKLTRWQHLKRVFRRSPS
jgi:hypothetical protein